MHLYVLIPRVESDDFSVMAESVGLNPEGLETTGKLLNQWDPRVLICQMEE